MSNVGIDGNLNCMCDLCIKHRNTVIKDRNDSISSKLKTVSSSTRKFYPLLPFIFDDIQNERDRQEQLKASGKFAWTCADIGPSHAEKNAVLVEEVGEVAREVVEQGIEFCKLVKDYNSIVASSNLNPVDKNDKLRKELIEVATVCVAWIEAIDKNDPRRVKLNHVPNDFIEGKK